jgi:hypothetical protein
VEFLQMKLRTQISLLLFLFGLVPLLAGFVINVPMIFDRIETLYHKAHLQNLRAGFSDLDQHIVPILTGSTGCCSTSWISPRCCSWTVQASSVFGSIETAAACSR